MSDFFDKIFNDGNNSEPSLDDIEMLCRNICSTLADVIENVNTLRGRQLIVWLDCENQVVFDQYNNKNYRDLTLTNLAQKGFEFEQVTFKMGKPTEDNRNTFRIGDNDLEYLEVADSTAARLPVCKKAVVYAIDGLGAVCPIQSEYELSSEAITSGRIQAYNIGRGRFVQKDGAFRENHIVFDDSTDSPLREHYLNMSRNHAHIGFDATKGFFFQVDDGGAYPGKTLLINGGKQINCDCVNTTFPLQDGDKIIVKNETVIETMLIYNELSK